MKYRRGQAALEFLSTYGFAFLIILVMVGALTYFGVLNPSGLVPNKCLSGNGITCNEVRITGAGTATAVADISLTNDRGTTTTIAVPTGGATLCSIPGYGNVAAPGGAGGAGSTGLSTTLAGATVTSTGIAPGSRFYVRCSLTLGAGVFPSSGEKLKAQAFLTYTDAGDAFPQPVSVDITQSLT